MVVVVAGAMDITGDEVHTEVMDIVVVVAEVVVTTLVEVAARRNRPRKWCESWFGSYIDHGACNPKSSCVISSLLFCSVNGE